MAARALVAEERIGLVLALAAHAGLVALILWRPPSAPSIPPPERVTVTISEEVAPLSTSPEPMAQPAPSTAPELGKSEPLPEALPEPPLPAPAPMPKALPEPRPQPAPRPSPRAAPVPAPRTAASPAARPRAVPRPAPAPSPSARPSSRPGASRIGSNFLPPAPAAQASGASRNPPAAAIGPAVRSAIGQAISRQLKPHWVAPQGAEAELLVTIVRFRLDRDGSLIGSPEVVGQSGETAANRAQVQRHAEQAIRAVRLAAPFDLPEEYYAAWQTVTSRFDKRLSQ